MTTSGKRIIEPDKVHKAVDAAVSKPPSDEISHFFGLLLLGCCLFISPFNKVLLAPTGN